MFKRRKAALAVLAVAASAVFVLPASPASAASTCRNACRNSVTANNSQIGVDTTADRLAGPGGTGWHGHADNLTQTANVPGAIFVAGYNLGLLVEGANTIPATRVDVHRGDQHGGGRPADELSRADLDLPTTITDPDGTPGTGDETATDGLVHGHLQQPDVHRLAPAARSSSARTRASPLGAADGRRGRRHHHQGRDRRVPQRAVRLQPRHGDPAGPGHGHPSTPAPRRSIDGDRSR